MCSVSSSMFTRGQALSWLCIENAVSQIVLSHHISSLLSLLRTLSSDAHDLAEAISSIVGWIAVIDVNALALVDTNGTDVICECLTPLLASSNLACSRVSAWALACCCRSQRRFPITPRLIDNLRRLIESEDSGVMRAAARATGYKHASLQAAYPVPDLSARRCLCAGFKANATLFARDRALMVWFICLFVAMCLVRTNFLSSRMLLQHCGVLGIH